MAGKRRTAVLKIDVDTHRGLGEGVPRLLRVLDTVDVKASFFVVMGPDRSGRAVFRALTQRGFLAKMLRTRALTLYGWRTILSGTLLPARPVGSGSPALLREMARRGHEVGIHAWDHVAWHDHLHRMTLAQTRAAFGRAVEAYRGVFGRPPLSSAAPGWQATPHSFRVMDEAGLLYHADTRGTAPYVPSASGTTFRALELPTTLPTLDELLGTAPRARILDRLVEEAADQDPCIFTAHAETEGQDPGFLHDFVLRLRDRGFDFARGIDLARRLLARPAGVPACGFRRGRRPHRGGLVTIQGA